MFDSTWEIDFFTYFAIVGSVSFYWGHFIPNRQLGLHFAMTPGYAMLLGLFLMGIIEVW